MTIRKMKLKRILGLAFFLCAMVAAVEAQALDEIRPGQEWPDRKGEHINAQGRPVVP